MSDFNGVIRWKDIAEHLRFKHEAAVKDLEQAGSDREIGRAQGRMSVYRELQNLPETLAAYAAHAKEAEKNHG